MRQLIFALQFRGSAGPVQGSQTRLQAKTSASGQRLRTAFGPAGVDAAVETTGGTSATFESEVEMRPDGTFLESGRITYGGAGTVHFRTVGQGTLGPSPLDGVQRGAVIWEVTRGEGGLAGATGLITSNFSVGAGGDVIDNQFAQLFVK
jgi:hypothetical protein